MLDVGFMMWDFGNQKPETRNLKLPFSLRIICKLESYTSCNINARVQQILVPGYFFLPLKKWNIYAMKLIFFWGELLHSHSLIHFKNHHHFNSPNISFYFPAQNP